MRCRTPEAQADTPQPEAEQRQAKTGPLEEKKSVDWRAQGLTSCMALAEQLAKSRGITCMSTLALNEQGVSLGIVDVRCRTLAGRYSAA